MDAVNPRFSTSDCLLEHAIAHLGAEGADTRVVRLRDLAFRHCEGNYSKASHACTWPCAITERDPTDELTEVYEGLVHWADVVLIATPIRWGAASSLYFKMAERLNCIQNQLTIHNRRLIMNKVAALIITGGQDNIQAVAGGMLTFWSELGFVFPAFPFIAHSRGWDAEDMQNNVRQVRESQPLRPAAAELADRALGTWRVLDKPPRGDGRTDGARRPEGQLARPEHGGGRWPHERPHAHRPRLRGLALRRTHGRGGRGVHRRRGLLGGGRPADRRRMARARGGPPCDDQPRAGAGRGRLGLRGRLARLVRGRRPGHRRDPRAQLAPLRARRRDGPAHLRGAPVPWRPHLRTCATTPTPASTSASWPATGASCPSSRRAELRAAAPSSGRPTDRREGSSSATSAVDLRRLEDQRDALAPPVVQQPAERRRADLPLADQHVAVLVGAQRAFAVVEMEERRRLAGRGLELVEDAGERVPATR